MKNTLLIFSLLFGITIVSGCSEGHFLQVLGDKNDSFLLTKSDVQSLKEVEDAAGKKAIFVELTNSGQLKMKNFTENNIGGKVSIYFTDIAVIENIPIVESSAMEKFHLSVGNKDLIKKIINSYSK